MSYALTPRERIILREIEKAAHSKLPCPSNNDLCRALGVKSRATTVTAIKRLEDKGLLVVERASNFRVATIVTSGLRTAIPEPLGPHSNWRELMSLEPRISGPIPAPVFRDPCPWCNTRRDYGCKHFPLENNA